MKDIGYYEVLEDRILIHVKREFWTVSIEWLPVTFSEIRKSYKHLDLKPRIEKIISSTRGYYEFDNVTGEYL